MTEAHEPAELDAIATGLGRVATAPEDAAPITWRMRQIVLGRLILEATDRGPAGQVSSS